MICKGKKKYTLFFLHLNKIRVLSNIARLTSAVAVKKLSFMMFNTLVLLDMRHVVALIAEVSMY